LEAKLEEDLSTIPKRKGSIDVHIAESKTSPSIEATTAKVEGEPVSTLSVTHPKMM
jgi:hypothetical protein